jgi:DNA (cytosine-5)-methyltransferase 1
LFELITFVANNKMKHLGLFEGIGGFSLAARWMGWETLAWCEWNEFGQKVLKHHFPEAEGFGDITKTDFTKYANRIDILTGGFPCQPYSAAGKRLGKEDERHLWPEMLRVIREVQPSWVVGENVLGLVNWSGGLVFHEVQADLEAAGYEVFPFVLNAASVGAPHKRDRVWFVAYANRIGHEHSFGKQSPKDSEWRERGSDSIEGASKVASNTNGNGFNQCNGQYEINTSKGGEYAFGNANKGNVDGDAADTDSFGQASGCEQHESDKQGHNIGSNSKGHPTDTERIRQSGPWRPERQGGSEAYRNWKASWSDPNGGWPTQSPLCSRNDGLSIGLVGITVSKHRQESLKAYGNAIVPQVAFQIFKAIAEYESLQSG